MCFSIQQKEPEVSKDLADSKPSATGTENLADDVLPKSEEDKALQDRLADCASRNGGFQKWFVGIVPNNTERVYAGRIATAGYNVFLPTQTYYSIWKDGRRKKRERIVLPHLLFIRCEEKERLQLLKTSLVRHFMTNKSGTIDKHGRHPIVIIPDKQIDTFKFMLDKADEEVSFGEFCIQSGMKVQVIRGSLRGLEGIVTDMNTSKTRVYVNMDFIGNVNVLIDTNSLRRIKE